MLFSKRYPCILFGAEGGSCARAPENTLPAFAAAVREGADFVVASVQWTSEHVPMILGEEQLDRMLPNDRRRTARAFATGELAKLDAGSWFVRSDPYGTIADGTLEAEEIAAFSGLGTATLDALLGLAQKTGTGLLLELDKGNRHAAPDDQELEKMLDVIRKKGVAERVLLASEQPERIAMLKQKAPEMARALVARTRRPDNPLQTCQESGATHYMASPPLLPG